MLQSARYLLVVIWIVLVLFLYTVNSSCANEPTSVETVRKVVEETSATGPTAVYQYGDLQKTPKMQKNPTGCKEGEDRVLRGGSFLSSVADCRSAKRDKMSPESSKEDVGFRVVLVPKNSPFFNAFKKNCLVNLEKEETQTF